jgi:antitoxin component YwqK of YwqJK toxin-antitoxin module
MYFYTNKNAMKINLKKYLFLSFSLCLGVIYAQPRIEKYPNGNIKLEENYEKNGLQHGKQTYYYENGKIAKELSYRKGKNLDR